MFVDTSVLLRCYFAFVFPILEYCSPVLGLLLKSPSASWAPGVFDGQALLWIVSCRCVIDVLLLGWECCTRWIRTLLTVCSASFHLLLIEFDILGLEFEVSRCRTSKFARCFLPAQVRMHNDFPYTMFDTRTLDGFKGAVNHWLLPWVMFSSVFRGAGACGVAKATYKQLCFSHLNQCCWF